MNRETDIYYAIHMIGYTGGAVPLPLPTETENGNFHGKNGKSPALQNERYML